jgi:hypothetical protein
MASKNSGEILMSQHFTVFGGAFVQEAHTLSEPQLRAGNGVALWGLVLATLLFGVTTVATVTATAWAHGAVY